MNLHDFRSNGIQHTFAATITATNSPTGYSAILQSGNTSMLGGLSVNPYTGLISGTPTTACTYNTFLNTYGHDRRGGLDHRYASALRQPTPRLESQQDGGEPRGV